MSTDTEISYAIGLLRDLPIEKYHGYAKAISNSGLRNLAKSPFHYFSLHLDPLRPRRVEKPGQLEGNLAHCAILEPLELARRYIVGPDVRANTNEWKAFVAAHAKQTVVKAEQMETARAQAVSVRSLKDSAELLSRGEAEVSVFWDEKVVDPDTGEVTKVPCRCRPDWVHPVNDDSVILCDVKTFSSADAREFSTQVQRKGYHNQEAFYRRGYELATGKKVVAFCFMVTEMEFPHASAAYMLDDDWGAIAEHENNRLLQLYARCLQTNTWPSYSDSIQLIPKPQWLR